MVNWATVLRSALTTHETMVPVIVTMMMMAKMKVEMVLKGVVMMKLASWAMALRSALNTQEPMKEYTSVSEINDSDKFLQIQTFCQRKTSHTSWKASQCFASFETSLAPWFLWSLLSSHRGAARNTGQELQTLRLHKMKSFVFVFAALALFCLQIWVGYLFRLFWNEMGCR